MKKELVYYEYKGKGTKSVTGMTGYQYRWQQDDIRLVHKEDEPTISAMPGMVKIGI